MPSAATRSDARSEAGRGGVTRWRGILALGLMALSAAASAQTGREDPFQTIAPPVPPAASPAPVAPALPVPEPAPQTRALPLDQPAGGPRPVPPPAPPPVIQPAAQPASAMLMGVWDVSGENEYACHIARPSGTLTVTRQISATSFEVEQRHVWVRRPKPGCANVDTAPYTIERRGTMVVNGPTVTITFENENIGWQHTLQGDRMTWVPAAGIGVTGTTLAYMRRVAGAAPPPPPVQSLPRESGPPRAPVSNAVALAYTDRGDWATRGAPTLAEAQRLALEACARVAGRNCQLAQQYIAPNTRRCMVIRRQGNNLAWWVGGEGDTLERTRAEGDAFCRRRYGEGCREVYAFCSNPS